MDSTFAIALASAPLRLRENQSTCRYLCNSRPDLPSSICDLRDRSSLLCLSSASTQVSGPGQGDISAQSFLHLGVLRIIGQIAEFVGIGPVVFAPIPDEQKRMILGLTQARLLDKVGVLPMAIKKRYKL